MAKTIYRTIVFIDDLNLFWKKTWHAR